MDPQVASIFKESLEKSSDELMAALALMRDILDDPESGEQALSIVLNVVGTLDLLKRVSGFLESDEYFRLGARTVRVEISDN